tara:strand:- start:417 stop:953 length:537 start_codon:yes stop_codon:yes gene_type:complete
VTTLGEISAHADVLRLACRQLLCCSAPLLPTPQALIGIAAAAAMVCYVPSPATAVGRSGVVRAAILWQLLATALTVVVCVWVAAALTLPQLWQQWQQGCLPSCAAPRQWTGLSTLDAVMCDAEPERCDCPGLCPAWSPVAVVVLEFAALLLNIILADAAIRVYRGIQNLRGVGSGLLL